MRLLLKDYLKEIKERDELDRLLPDLLTEMGFRVFSIPQRGPNQFGVDVGAVGRCEGDKTSRLYLFVIKCKNISRKEWSRESQGVRASVEDCLDVYIPNFRPIEYVKLPITICICCGGEVSQEAVPYVESYKKKVCQKYGHRIETWDGDKLAGLVNEYFCNTKLFGDGAPSNLLRTLAMVSDPELSFKYFREMVPEILGPLDKQPFKKKLSKVRRLNLCLGILYSWGVNAGNIESAYLAAEIVLINVWRCLWMDSRSIAAKKRQLGKSIDAFLPTLRFYFRIATAYVMRIRPYLDRPYLFTFSTGGNDEVDVNLKTFEVLGRFASLGLAINCYYDSMKDAWKGRNETEMSNAHMALEMIEDSICALLQYNPTACWAMKDSYAGVISQVCLFLRGRNRADVVKSWVAQIVSKLGDEYARGMVYPVVGMGYAKLLTHAHCGAIPKEKVSEILPSTELLPTLALIANYFKMDEVYDSIVSIQENVFPKTDFQLLFYDGDVEDAAMGVLGNAGLVWPSISLKEREMLVRCVRDNATQKSLLKTIPPVLYGILFVGLRHHGMPLPTSFWLVNDEQMEGGSHGRC